MSVSELTEKALALSKAERIRLAQSLWASVEDNDLPSYAEEELKGELQQRLCEEPNESWKTHEQIMNEAKQKFGC